MATFVFLGLASAFPKLASDFRAAVSARVVGFTAPELFLRLASRAILFWLVFRVCCCAFLACAYDMWSPRQARWFCIGDARSAATHARIRSARSRRERFLFEHLYLARRTPCIEELEAVCRGGWVRGDPAIAVDFALRRKPTESIQRVVAGSARITFLCGPRAISTEVLQRSPGPASEAADETGCAPTGGPPPPQALKVFPFPFGAIDLAEIHSCIWPPAPTAPDGTKVAEAIARVRARRQAVLC